jgi:hypothetical protein
MFASVVESLAALSAEELVARVLEGAAEQSAHHALWLSALAEVERRELWGEAGVRSLAHWLEFRVGMDGRTAREHVRVMHRLEELHRVRDVYAEGRLSYSKVRALCRVATPQSEEFLVGLALELSASALERQLAAFVKASAEPISLEDDTARRAMCGADRWVDDSGLVHYEIVAAPEDALMIDKAMSLGCDEVHAERRAKAAAAGEPRPARVRGRLGRYEGLVWAVRNGLVNIARGVEVDDPYLVTFDVHAGAAFFTDDGLVDTGTGLQIHPRTLQRLCCSSMIQVMLYGEDGSKPLDLGRAQRNFSRKQRRAARVRYPTCGFPGGCEVPSERCIPHHVRWWVRDEGPTDLDNLLPLCRSHHWMVHEGGCNLVFGVDGRPVLLDADGRTHDGTAPPLPSVDPLALRRKLRARGVAPSGAELAGVYAGERMGEFASSVIVEGIWRSVYGDSRPVYVPNPVPAAAGSAPPAAG